jgi:hypothetical protein
MLQTTRTYFLHNFLVDGRKLSFVHVRPEAFSVSAPRLVVEHEMSSSMGVTVANGDVIASGGIMFTLSTARWRWHQIGPIHALHKI